MAQVRLIDKKVSGVLEQWSRKLIDAEEVCLHRCRETQL